MIPYESCIDRQTRLGIESVATVLATLGSKFMSNVA